MSIPTTLDSVKSLPSRRQPKKHDQVLTCKQNGSGLRLCSAPFPSEGDLSCPSWCPNLLPEIPNILLPGHGAFFKIFERLSRCHPPGFTPRTASRLSFQASIPQRDMAPRKASPPSPTWQFLARCSSFLLPPLEKSPDSICHHSEAQALRSTSFPRQ